MPIYEYECTECKNGCEELSTSIDSKSTKMIYCKVCKKEQSMTRCISLSTFKLVGRGWGKDGYMNTYEQAKDMI
jgi:putative FmdB family regulatory protein